MGFRILVDLVVIGHFLFVVFVVAGSALVYFWPRVAWLHLPAVAWGAGIEFSGGVCPLTPLENWLRSKAGMAGYEVDFIERYVWGLLYPTSLTPLDQLILGLAVIAINVTSYYLVWFHLRDAAKR